jgi:hypothetical protein
MFCAFLQGVVLYIEECATSTSTGPRAWLLGKALCLETPGVRLCRVWCAYGLCALEVYCMVCCVQLPTV